MEEVTLKSAVLQKYNTLEQALSTLEIVIKRHDKTIKNNPTPDSETIETLRIERDSLIQRFEYCTELFWKFLKKYIEFEEISIDLVSPRGIIRACVHYGIITEQQGILAYKMIDYRNQTSHIYREEIADIISGAIPEFYTFIQSTAHQCIIRLQQ